MTSQSGAWGNSLVSVWNRITNKRGIISTTQRRWFQARNRDVSQSSS